MELWYAAVHYVRGYDVKVMMDTFESHTSKKLRDLPFNYKMAKHVSIHYFKVELIEISIQI